MGWFDVNERDRHEQDEGEQPPVDRRLLQPDPGETLEEFKRRLLAEVLELRAEEANEDDPDADDLDTDADDLDPGAGDPEDG